MVENRYIAPVITVAADGLALLGARPSASTVLTMFMSHMYTESAPNRLKQ